MEFSSPEANFYFERFGFCPPQIDQAPRPELGIVVVIPSFNEPDLVRSLESLWSCNRPTCAVEVIVVVNSAEGDPETVRRCNDQTLMQAVGWAANHQDPSFNFFFLHFPDLPRKHAGVGLARKLGMDEAVSRFDHVRNAQGVILSFDADCSCEPNYLEAVERYFAKNPKTPGASIYFEHPLEGRDEPRIYEAITLYELHLRYYVQALRFAQFPHAYHTIGSSMAVRANAYLRQGGMNKRQAGEDFYFLHKIIPLGAFGEINQTRIIPSPRSSDRVPFGTGRAVREFLQSGRFETYPLQAFAHLKELFSRAGELRHRDRIPLAAPLTRFLEDQKFQRALIEIRANTADETAFIKRFFRWFDGFKAMKYIHFARDSSLGAGELLSSARELYAIVSGETERSITARELLYCYRSLQRQTATRPHPPVEHLPSGCGSSVSD